VRHPSACELSLPSAVPPSTFCRAQGVAHEDAGGELPVEARPEALGIVIAGDAAEVGRLIASG
jgi:hypothetical protein